MVLVAETGQQLIPFCITVGVVVLTQGQVRGGRGCIEGNASDPDSLGIDAKSNLTVFSSLLFEEGKQGNTSDALVKTVNPFTALAIVPPLVKEAITRSWLRG
jgi:hypothetical protein